MRAKINLPAALTLSAKWPYSCLHKAHLPVLLEMKKTVTLDGEF